MLDRHNERDGRAERERPLRPSDEMGNVRGEREVPLSPVATPDVINRWLDGELPEPTGLRGDAARSVEFWRRLGEETDKRRRMMTPAHLPEKIMASLPPLATPQTSMVPWYRKDMKLNPMMALAAGAALFTLGLVAAQALLR
ncbi:MAG: hypothetical protein IPF87_17685 [Gemmatimonadetes bacterium]|jgi:hypothetical protein|nr:hypothetical protein [Gemmatimonadota bacterium]MCC7324723.1 hypothetical protein [Gemmatimonadaceae bacterium]MBK6457887.1 hypothetical protein [Gemmatimonadota bacterium]MBK6844563.1 hypothetical protein [Gemmatimonadota bacterium]MBK7833680.1 hypothetical protein [Gemmatimonadota bacterium]